MYKINYAGATPATKMCGSMAFNYYDSIKLDAAIDTPSLAEIIHGDASKYISRLYLTPINMFNYEDGVNAPIDIQLDTIDTRRCLNAISNRVYYCGTYKFVSIDYLDYEPYTKCECFLPFYGLTEIPMKYLNKYYITFIMIFSPSTGEATYVITADSNAPVYNGDDNLKSRAMFDNYTSYTEFIIKKISFNAAMDVPIYNNGSTEILRNISLATLSAGIGVLSSNMLAANPVSTMSRVTTTKRGITTMTERTKNPKTNRLNISTKQTLEYEPDKTHTTSELYRNSDYGVIGSISNGIDTAIHSMSLKPEFDKIMNTALQINDEWAIHIYITRQKVGSIDGNLSPKPCFKSGRLIDGYSLTEIGIHHFNTYNKYNSPKTNELEIIKDMLKGQIICRPKLTNNPIILGDEFSKELLYNKSIFENLNDVDDVINNNGMINVNGYRIYHNHIPVRYDDFPSTRKYFIANLPLGQDTFNLSFDFCNNVIPNIAPNTYWEDIVNTNDITSVDGNIHINAKFNNVTNIDLPIIYNSTNSSVEEKDMIIPSENKTTYSSNVRAFKVITEDGDKLFYFGNETTWGEFVLNPTYNVEIDWGSNPFTFENNLVLYKGNTLLRNGLPVTSGSNIYLYENTYTVD